MDSEIISSISTDGAASAVIGKEKGVIKLLTNKIESDNKTNNSCKRDGLIMIHCIIHQKNLCSQGFSINHVTEVVINTVDYMHFHITI